MEENLTSALEKDSPSPLRNAALYCLVAGSVLTLLLAAWATSRVIDHQRDQFREKSSYLLNSIATRLSTGMSMTLGLRAFYDASEYVSADEFAIFSTTTLKNFDYAIATIYAPRITATGRDAFEQQIRTAGHERGISNFDDHRQLRTAPNRDYYFPLRYLQPTHAAAYDLEGVDLLENWRDAAAESFVTDKVLAAPASFLPLGDTDNLALLTPIYQKNHTQNILAQVVGIVAIIVDKNLLLETNSLPFNSDLQINFGDNSHVNFFSQRITLPSVWKISDELYTRHISVGNQTIELKLHGTLYLERGDIFTLFGALALGIVISIVAYVILRSNLLAALASTKDKAKSEFLAVASHEIRTPLNGVLGMTELLERTPLTEEQHSYVKTIATAGQSLLEVINDVLDISKIEANRMRLEIVNFNLAQVLSEVADIYRVAFLNRGIVFDVAMTAAVPEHVSGDPARLRQILNNLLSNALKFTERGAVTLHVKCTAQQEKRCRLRFEVTDTGIGIARDRQGGVFDAYTQASDWTVSRYGGTGLGLSICKQLIALMGGTIGVESEPGKGSIFWFETTLPYEPNAPIDTTMWQGKHVLVIANSEAARQSSLDHVNALSMCATTASNTQLAWSWLEAHSAALPDLIIIDILPVAEHAAEFVARLARERSFSHIPVLLYSHTRPAGTYPNLRYVGAKPCSAARLAAALKNYKSDTAQQQSGTVVELMQPLNILVAEDNIVNIAVLKSMLKQLGHRSTFCENGETALAAYCKSPQRFDVILMDCEMPVLDGFGATHAIRAFEHQQSLPSIPIVALTAHAFREQQTKCLEAGMDRYLSKPITLATLMATLQQYQRPFANSAQN